MSSLIVCGVSLLLTVQQQSPALRGVVADSLGAPIQGVDVRGYRDASTVQTAFVTRTAADGSFLVDYPASGILVLRVRRIGYRAHMESILVDTLRPSRTIRITLLAAPFELDPVSIAGAEYPSLKAFAERKKKGGSGHFVDRSQIEKQRATYSSELLRSFPGLVIRPSGKIGNSIRIRGCRPSVWIDGVQALNAELDEVSVPADIAGIEVYPSWAGVPVQFSDRQGRNCGAILVWTRLR